MVGLLTFWTIKFGVILLHIWISFRRHHNVVTIFINDFVIQEEQKILYFRKRRNSFLYRNKEKPVKDSSCGQSVWFFSKFCWWRTVTYKTNCMVGICFYASIRRNMYACMELLIVFGTCNTNLIDRSFFKIMLNLLLTFWQWIQSTTSILFITFIMVFI